MRRPEAHWYEFDGQLRVNWHEKVWTLTHRGGKYPWLLQSEDGTRQEIGAVTLEAAKHAAAVWLDMSSLCPRPRRRA